MGSLIQLLDRPIAYQPSYANLKSGKVRSGPVAAVFLSQMVYWHNRMDGGWMYKSQQDIRNETSLTRDEQETARKRLVALGVLEEQLRGVPATMHYRVNAERLEQLLLGEPEAISDNPSIQIAAIHQTGTVKHGKQECGDTANKAVETLQTSQRQSHEQACGDPTNFLTVDYTEITHKTTQDIDRRENATNKKSQPSPKKTKTKKHTMPEDFAPTEKHQELACELGVDLQEEFLKFRDHHGSKGSTYAKWDLALNTWLRNAKTFQRGQQGMKTQARRSAGGLIDLGNGIYIRDE